MKNFYRVFSAFSALLALSSAALASEGRIVVVCGNTHFSDLETIEIRETDLMGQYQLVETLKDIGPKKGTTRYSPVFDQADIEKSEFPELTPWNGYTRRLVRYGRDNYRLTIQDECTSSSVAIDCRESF